MNKYLRHLLSFLVLLAFVVNANAQAKTERDDNVVVQMNYCINTLTNIIHNKSMAVLEHESDQLVNNLTMEQIIGLYEIKDFRIDLMDAVSKFEITEEERSLMRRVQSIKRDNMKWSALSNALSPTMLLTGNGGGMGPQLAFQVLLTTARTAVEYKEMQGEQNIEELQAMWELRKEDMQTINDLRKTAQSIVFELYNKYHLKESDRLTESTANLFNEYVSEENAAKRIRILEDNAATYKVIPEFYYHLGMAYLDQNDYTHAKLNFSKYLEMYQRTPFLRYDERSGCIALAILANEQNLSANEKLRLIHLALDNMPNNSAAILQCAMVYIYDMGLYDEGFKLLRSGIDNAHATDREILYMAAANLVPIIKNNVNIYNAISEIFRSSKDKGYDSYITYLISDNTDVWEQLHSLNSFSKCYHRTYYTWWIGKKFSNEFHLTLPGSVVYHSNDFLTYSEKHKGDDVTIRQLIPSYKYAISEDDINNVKCFKSNKYLKYLYVEAIEPGIYKLKQNIDIKKIKDETWPRQSEFVLSEGDIKDIVKFCKNNMPKSDGTELRFSDIKSTKHTVKLDDDKNAVFYGDTLAYTPHHSKVQEGYYVRMIFKNGMQIVYKYQKGNFQPYYYSDAKIEYFWDNESEDEYKYQEQIEVSKEEAGKAQSWFSKTISTINGWFSSKKDKTNVESNEEVVNEGVKPTKHSTSINSAKKKKNIDKDQSSDTHEENAINNSDKQSWFSKTWSSLKSWFSSVKKKQPNNKK